MAAVGRVGRNGTGGRAAGEVVAVAGWNSTIRISLFYCKSELGKTRHEIAV